MDKSSHKQMVDFLKEANATGRYCYLRRPTLANPVRIFRVAKLKGQTVFHSQSMMLVRCDGDILTIN